jgi:putative transcriptional regulator
MADIAPPSVRAVRNRLRLSQPAFAKAFGLSLSSVRNWEQGIRRPEQPAALLLHLINDHPEIVAACCRRLAKKSPR